ncbi:hypothetical protein [Kitasatospora sp. NPDC002040]|uniref:hypothetical protein n=1 Tax=Kitasatospora sp. NPDC002040 TaxID=3154661 RepID=UPI0033304EED
MAGMSITVCLPSREDGRVEEAVAKAMAPFEIDYTRGEDLDIWDSWRITGGTAHGGGFNVLPGHEGDARLLHEFPNRWWPGHVPVPNDFGWCAGGPRELLDFSASPEAACELADAVWQRWHQLAAELPPPRSLDFYLARHFAEAMTYSSQQAHADYVAQPLVRAFTDYLKVLPTERFSSAFLFLADPVAKVGGSSREEFIARCTPYALRRRNVLTLEGWWYEDGDPGVHGACHSDACPHEPDLAPGFGHVNSYLAALPGGTLLVNVHCHV